MSIDVSVIVPTYNRAGLITETLDSILGQSHLPSEVIVVDDGSTDNTETIVRCYGRGVKYLYIENSGAPRARNVGVAAATADWIAFCDSDDLWHPEKLRLQIRLFENAPEVEYGFTNFKTVVNGEWSKETKFDSLPPYYWNLAQSHIDEDSIVIRQPMFDRVLTRQPIFPSSVMLKRIFLEKIGGWNEQLGRTRGEDWEFTLRCVGSPIGVVFVPVVGIRKHDSNFSGDQLGTLLGEIAVLEYVLDHNSVLAAEYSRLIREQISIRTANGAEAAFALGDFKQMQALLESVPFRSLRWKLQLKALIAYMPENFGRVLQRAARNASGLIRRHV